MSTLTKVMKAAFDFVFGLQFDDLQSVEDERKDRSRAINDSPMVREREWEAVAFPQPYFSLTGQAPTHIYSAWR
ncbi:hypothetical protein C8Q70DRAFT_1058829 [Cubamyces menziesii]|uniref:Uncharacterized protein n=1 Tax=Trametes cubensis TaxID=1111947 RepID=A0AAD7TRI0_9APHY|nr:hypothetical protein C8Q70DRAFT_1058829 [Cubamyces menziesii]KAJ8474268.1 hypothetical protein ONZ51_g7332 [Trametes cubensis]